MTRYQSKPKPVDHVEAMRWDGTNHLEILEWLRGIYGKVGCRFNQMPDDKLEVDFYLRDQPGSPSTGGVILDRPDEYVVGGQGCAPFKMTAERFDEMYDLEAAVLGGPSGGVVNIAPGGGGGVGAVSGSAIPSTVTIGGGSIGFPPTTITTSIGSPDPNRRPRLGDIVLVNPSHNDVVECPGLAVDEVVPGIVIHAWLTATSDIRVRVFPRTGKRIPIILARQSGDLGKIATWSWPGGTA